MKLFLTFLFITLCTIHMCLAQAPGEVPTEGGNITAVSLMRNAVWHGVCGQVSNATFAPVTVNATAGHIGCLTMNVGQPSCPGGVKDVFLLFSNSSAPISSLSAGNLTTLDAFINRSIENGTATFTLSRSFSIPGFGTIGSVPSAYTFSPVPAFLMGYMQDQAGNIVIAVPVVSRQPGFNGSLFDFQLMLPTRDAQDTPYYVTEAFSCVPPVPPPPPPPPQPSGPPQGGGGTHTPYYNQTKPPPANVTNATNVTNPCDIVLYCGEWGQCVDGYRTQSCKDLANCSSIEIFRVEKCPPPPINITKPPTPEEVVTIIVSPESRCCPLVVFLLLAIGIISYYAVRKNTWLSQVTRRMRP